MDIPCGIEPDMRGHDRHEQMLARPERGYPDGSTLEVGDAPDIRFGEQLEAAGVHAGQYGDRTAPVDQRYPLRREMKAEVHVAAHDRLVERGGRCRVDETDIGKAFGAQQVL